MVTTTMTMTMLLIMMMTTMRFHVAGSLPHNSVLRPLHGLKSAPARRRFFHRATPPPIRQSPWWQGPRKADSVWGCTPPLRMGRRPPPSPRPLVASPGWKPPRSDAACCLAGSSGRWPTRGGPTSMEQFPPIPIQQFPTSTRPLAGRWLASSLATRRERCASGWRGGLYRVAGSARHCALVVRVLRGPAPLRVGLVWSRW